MWSEGMKVFKVCGIKLKGCRQGCSRVMLYRS